MSINKKWTVAAALGLGFSIVGVGIWAQDTQLAVQQPGGVSGVFRITLVSSRVLTGDDIGIAISTLNGQVIGLNGDVVTGRLVVRVDGRWLTVAVAPPPN